MIHAPHQMCIMNTGVLGSPLNEGTLLFTLFYLLGESTHLSSGEED